MSSACYLIAGGKERRTKLIVTNAIALVSSIVFLAAWGYDNWPIKSVSDTTIRFIALVLTAWATQLIIAVYYFNRRKENKGDEKG